MMISVFLNISVRDAAVMLRHIWAAKEDSCCTWTYVCDLDLGCAEERAKLLCVVPAVLHFYPISRSFKYALGFSKLHMGV